MVGVKFTERNRKHSSKKKFFFEKLFEIDDF